MHKMYVGTGQALQLMLMSYIRLGENVNLTMAMLFEFEISWDIQAQHSLLLMPSEGQGSWFIYPLCVTLQSKISWYFRICQLLGGISGKEGVQAKISCKIHQGMEGQEEEEIVIGIALTGLERGNTRLVEAELWAWLRVMWV